MRNRSKAAGPQIRASVFPRHPITWVAWGCLARKRSEPADRISDFVATANQHIEEAGMSLRDYFAGQALAGICTRNLMAFDTREIAKLAYDVADAMLEKRIRMSEPYPEAEIERSQALIAEVLGLEEVVKLELRQTRTITNVLGFARGDRARGDPRHL